MRITRGLALALVCIAVPIAGCGGPGTPSSTGTSPVLPSQPAASAAPGAEWWETGLLTEPEYTSKVIAAERKGHGEAVLPPITSAGEQPIRVVVACSGLGQLSVLVNKRHNDTQVQCDKIRTFIDIYTEAGEQEIALSTGPEIRWKVAVIRK